MSLVLLKLVVSMASIRLVGFRTRGCQGIPNITALNLVQGCSWGKITTTLFLQGHTPACVPNPHLKPQGSLRRLPGRRCLGSFH